MDKILVSLGGILAIALIYWFFFGKREEAMEGDQTTIIVDGGYKPSIIRIPKGQPAKLTFIRKDSNTCLEDLYFPDYKIKTYLPMNKPVTVTLNSQHLGKSGFHCGMNMFHGRIEVVA